MGLQLSMLLAICAVICISGGPLADLVEFLAVGDVWCVVSLAFGLARWASWGYSGRIYGLSFVLGGGQEDEEGIGRRRGRNGRRKREDPKLNVRDKIQRIAT